MANIPFLLLSSNAVFFAAFVIRLNGIIILDRVSTTIITAAAAVICYTSTKRIIMYFPLRL